MAIKKSIADSILKNRHLRFSLRIFFFELSDAVGIISSHLSENSSAIVCNFSNCFPNHPFAITSGVKNIYNGDKYSDTCLAEINLLCKSNNYLFGELYAN
jgi:hypothetical protein